MFGFLKDKLKGALSKFTKKVEEAPEEEVEVEKELAPPKVEKPTNEVKEKPKKEEKAKKSEPSKEKKFEAKKAEKVKEVKPKKVEKEEPIVQEEPVKVEPAQIEVAPEPVKVEDELAVEQVKVEPGPVKAEPEPVKVEPEPAKGGFFSRLKETFVGKTEELKAKEPKVEPVEKAQVKPKSEAPKVAVEPSKVEESKGFFSRMTEKITTKKVSAEAFDELFWDLELALLENNVAVEVIEKIKTDLKSSIVDKLVPRGKVEEVIASSLHESIDGLFTVPSIDVLSKIKGKKPYVICFIGINGSGKTTSIAKFTHYLQQNGLSVVLAAADTFRAAAIDQLQLHADNLKVKLIKHDYGSDPAAVAFDAIKHAEASKKDVVLIDTAGRLHSNVNLIDEMKKIVRVAKPDLKIFVGESITGNDCVEQAKKFDEAVGIDGIILSKADIDEKGGAAISVSFVTKKPILFLGMGQEYKDLQVFDKEKLLAGIGL